MDATSVPTCVWISQLRKKNPMWLWSETIEIVEFGTALPEYEIVWKISVAHLSTVKLAEEFSGGGHGITTTVAFYISSVLPPLGLPLQSLLPPHYVLSISKYIS